MLAVLSIGHEINHALRKQGDETHGELEMNPEWKVAQRDSSALSSSVLLEQR